jgi:hypothetical protein
MYRTGEDIFCVGVKKPKITFFSYDEYSAVLPGCLASTHKSNVLRWPFCLAVWLIEGQMGVNGCPNVKEVIQHDPAGCV